MKGVAFPPKLGGKNLKRYYHSNITPTQLNTLLNSTSTSQTKHNIGSLTQIHAQIITNNYISFPFLFNNLLNSYSKSGHFDHSLTLFSKIHNASKNIVTWTSLITHLSRCNRSLDAFNYFKLMRRDSIYPNEFTFSAVLPACGGSDGILHGLQVHCLVKKHGFECDVFVGSALVDMYGKCGDVMSSEKVFVEMPDRSIVTWNAMIVGLLENEFYGRAVRVFKEAFGEGEVIPDQVSVSSALSACASIGYLGFGRQVHGVALKYNLLSLVYVLNSLMDMYCKCGFFMDALRLFQTEESKDSVTWNVLAMGCIQNDDYENACSYFWVMRRSGVLPDEASFSTALHASANLAVIDQGSLIHDQIIKMGFSENTCVASSLITMYAKCGSLTDAFRVFNEIQNRNVVCWTAMIAAFQQHGCANQAIDLFENMVRVGHKPDYITFVCVLSACSHTGRVEEGFRYFDSMATLHNMSPGSEHYACMVDLLGRAGRLSEAKTFVEAMTTKPDASVWGALLGACRNHGNLEIGREVAAKLFEVEPYNPGNYILLANMYARFGKMEEANEMRRLMGANGVKKETGCSWIDIKNSTFVFTSYDRSHARTDEIYQMLQKLEELAKQKGYVPEIQFAVNSTEAYKERSLWHHSEKLALAFGLLTLPANAPIRIKKNLRTCGDCHTVMKYASEIFGRKIIVRDIKRFHHFTSGVCSCGDYW